MEAGRNEVTRLALEHRAEIWAYVMGLARNLHRAEDVFQNTYVVICEKWRQCRPGTNFLAWARQIARYEFLAAVDPGRKRFVTVQADVLESVLGSTDPVEEPWAQIEALKKCLGRLGRNSRRAVELRYGLGLACSAVAKTLRLTLNNTCSVLCRSRRLLRQCVERRLTAGEV